jgi:hypothetical protein
MTTRERLTRRDREWLTKQIAAAQRVLKKVQKEIVAIAKLAKQKTADNDSPSR